MVVSSIRSFLRRFVNSFLTETRTMTKNVSFQEKLDETTAEKQVSFLEKNDETTAEKQVSFLEKNDETTTEKREPVSDAMTSLTLDEKKFYLSFSIVNAELVSYIDVAVVRKSPFYLCFIIIFLSKLQLSSLCDDIIEIQHQKAMSFIFFESGTAAVKFQNLFACPEIRKYISLTFQVLILLFCCMIINVDDFYLALFFVRE
jgi:hypothetical protein